MERPTRRLGAVSFSNPAEVDALVTCPICLRSLVWKNIYKGGGHPGEYAQVQVGSEERAGAAGGSSPTGVINDRYVNKTVSRVNLVRLRCPLGMALSSLVHR